MSDVEFRKFFGAAITQNRRAKEWSQEKLAEFAGLHRTYIGSVERGERNVSLDNICKLAEALGTTGSELMAVAEMLQRSKADS